MWSVPTVERMPPVSADQRTSWWPFGRIGGDIT
jgi:hypothetical protein